MYDILTWHTDNLIFDLVIWYIFWFTPSYTDNVIILQHVIDQPYLLLAS